MDSEGKRGRDRIPGVHAAPDPPREQLREKNIDGYSVWQYVLVYDIVRNFYIPSVAGPG